MRNIFQILDYIMKFKGFTKDTELAKFFGVAQNTVSSWRRRGSVPHKRIIAICDQEGWNYQTILTGEGELIIEGIHEACEVYIDSSDPMAQVIKGLREIYNNQKKEIEKLEEMCEKVLERLSFLEEQFRKDMPGETRHQKDVTEKAAT